MSINPFETVKEDVALSPSPSDEVKYTTCYMCACRCGVKVHLRDGKLRYLEGNPDHPINKGVLCGKGSAGIMNHYSPARLKKPLLRTGPRGSGEFKEIEWDEALALATDWLGTTRASDPSKLAFFTGRDQSQSLTGWWAQQYGTRNFAAHGGFCSVNMAAAGLYTLGGAFWEFGEPDFDLTRYFMMFGVAEDHDSNPIKMGIGKMKSRDDGAKFVAVNPARTGYQAVADEWVGIRPGTDGMFVMALIHELLRAEKIDFSYLARYTNASWLVIDAPGTAEHGLFARDANGSPLAFDLKTGELQLANEPGVEPAFAGERELRDGRKARPAFELLARRYLSKEYAPEAAAKVTGIKAEDIRRIAAELAEAAFEHEVVIEQPWTDAWGRKHERMIGRPVSFHAMRGISAHSNGFHTCRSIHILQTLLGSVDVPGGWRYKCPFPRPAPPGPKPHGNCQPNQPLDGPPIGNPTGPGDLLVDADGNPMRIDKAFSWEHPMSSHGLMHMVLHNAWAGDPYPVDVLFMFMANMSWNSSMNIKAVHKYLTDTHEDGSYKIPKIIYSDAYNSEMIAYCDLVLPDTTYFERHDAISLLDRPIASAHGPADAIRHPVVEPDRDVRAFQTVLLDLGARLGLPGMVNADGSAKFPGGYADYIVNHERKPGTGPLCGWRGKDGTKSGVGEPNLDQIERYKENGAFWFEPLPMEKQYFKHVNKGYLEYSTEMGWIPSAAPIIHQLYSEPMQRFRLAAEGHGEHQPPEVHRERVATYFDPLPFWYQPFEEDTNDDAEFPLHALTQRPMHMYHSWGSQNAWLRQITAANRLHIHRETAKNLGIADDDWVWIESRIGKVRGQVRLVDGVNKNTVWTWNAIGKKKGAWGLAKDAPESNRGFLLNQIISELLPPKGGHHYSNSDPVTGQAAWFDLRVRVKKCETHDIPPQDDSYDAIPTQIPMVGFEGDVLRFGADMKGPASPAQAELQEWIGNRHEYSQHIGGFRDGHGIPGNRTEEH